MLDRRRLLMGAAAAGALPAAIARAAAIDAHVRKGTIEDVEHVVIFMQENRSFDHYFGAMNGVRGFGDRFPIPLPGERTVWSQANAPGAQPPIVAPFPLNTAQTFAHMRVEGTPHNWTDAQAAWDQGRMADWPAAKRPHAMGYYRAEDIPFQYALADAFTICDAYHCAMHTGTNTNRLFLFTGTNDPFGVAGGPSLSNTHDSLPEKGGSKVSFTWTTYVERLQKAGISWRLYQDMADNFTDNPLVGFESFRAAYARAPGSDPVLLAEALTTHTLESLKADVVADRLPQVSYIIADAKGSEHPGPSSPAQGADYTARVLDALTSNPAVWAKTVLFLMFDENDGFFDHMPPPAPPSRSAAGELLGDSSFDLAGEHHLVRNPTQAAVDRPELMGRPYGLGPRVPMYVVSPWSRGGWVNSEVFDHTSVVRFLETRFGVAAPEVSTWRRAVSGNLTSAFEFKTPNRAAAPKLPATAELAARAAALPKTTRPPTPAVPGIPEQAPGVRPSRALPYRPEVEMAVTPAGAALTFTNLGNAAAVFHVYDRLDLAPPPRRYTVGYSEKTVAEFPLHDGRCDLWILGPNGFHRHCRSAADPGLLVTPTLDHAHRRLTLSVRNTGPEPLEIHAVDGYAPAPWTVTLPPSGSATRVWPLAASGGWYDLRLTAPVHAEWSRRYAGRVESGRDSVTDPAMHGPALMAWDA